MTRRHPLGISRRALARFPRRSLAIGVLVAMPLVVLLVLRSGDAPPPAERDDAVPAAAEPEVGAAAIDERTLPEATLTSSVTEIEFGTVPLGESATRRLVLTNNALDETTITLSSTWLSEPDALEFASDFRGPLSVPAGESIAIELTFTPMEAGNRVGALYVSHDGASGLDIFTLGGNGALSSRDRALQYRLKPPGGEAPRFGKSTLGNLDSVKPTSLQFGPDGRLYVADMLGLIKIYDVERVGDNDYRVTSTETITAIRDIPNHDDDGRRNTKITKRLVTGLLVAGTASRPVIYVNSSDPRIGGGPSHTETNLDTNSGVLSRLVPDADGEGWTRLDLVRGLPRSEENHHPNGLALDEATNRLYLSTGGNTNQGAPSNNFAGLPEYALSAAILEIDLGRIGDKTYDLPTLDDETRAGVHDANDPFGGNDGRNQAKLVPGAPVQVYAPGFRNAYDLVLTEEGRLYTIDNGPNGGWGSTPIGEGPAGECTNARHEPGTTYPDSLHHVRGPGYYGGHPNPTRASLSNTFNTNKPQAAVAVANPIECDYRPGGGKDALTTFPMSVNGLVEYRASNFGGAMRGDLLAAAWNDVIYRLELDESGNALDGTGKSSLFTNAADLPLDVTAQADHERFPGTVWTADFVGKSIIVFEPVDFAGVTVGLCGSTGSGEDDDGDGFTNADESANGTDPCSAADLPSDLDGDFVSDLVDTDDDDDGLADKDDPFALDPLNGRGTPIPLSYTWENDSRPAGFLFNLGFSGLMSDGERDYLEQFDLGQLTAGGAAGVLTIDDIPPGDPINARNDQTYAFQFGVDVTSATPPFTVRTRLLAPFVGTELGGHLSAGLYVGTGDQDNYIKLVANASGESGGVEFAAEHGGTFARIALEAAEILGSDRADLFLTVDPGAATVTAYHQSTVDGEPGPIRQVGKAAAFPRAWLEGRSGLAVGIIATSFGGKPFGATWDFVDIANGGAIVTGADGDGFAEPDEGATDEGSLHVANGATIAIEAEHFIARADSSGHRWVAGTRGAASGGSMVTTPDKGAHSAWSDGAPRLSYAVDFPSAGTWTVWVRGWGDADASGEGKSDSVHVGLDGVLSTAAAMQGFPAGGWAWSSDRRGGGTATLTVDGAGRHTVDVWMREDGFELDRLLLTGADDYVPVGAGPRDLHALDGATGGGTTDEGDTDGADAGGEDTASDADGAGGESEPGTGTDGGDGDPGEGPASVGGGDVHGAGDGLIAIEAEHFAARTNTTGHAWVAAEDGEASAGIAMGTTPDVGTLAAGSNGSPRLSYAVEFPSAGTWTVWVRGKGDTNAHGEGKSDSVHVGLDGKPSAAVQDFPAGGWSWSKARRGGGAATLTVGTAGRHSVDVWMREDGFELDRLVLAKSGAYVPSERGPLESHLTSDADGGGTGDDGGDDASPPGDDGADAGAAGIHTASDGLIAIEAERFLSRTATTGHAWVNAGGAGASGGAAMVTAPDVGTLAAGSNGSPRLSYAVEFPSAGTWTVWVRGKGDTNAHGEGKSDSVHVGLDGKPSAAVQDFPAGGWSWSKARRGGGTATLTVGTAGRHSVDVWMREDGFTLDRLVLSKSIDYSPGGQGPTGTGTNDDSDVGAGDAGATGDVVRLDATLPWTRGTTADGSDAIARHESGAVELDGKLYLLGGRGSRATTIFDPATNRWTKGANPPFEMHHFQPVALGDRIYVVGAMTCCYPREKSVANVWTYTPSTNRWEKGATIPAGRLRGGAGTIVRAGKIYLVGGNTRGHDGGAVGWFDEFDPASGSWRVLPDTPAARDHVQVALVGDRLVLAGGRRSTQPDVFANTVARVDLYDFGTKKWTRAADIPTERAGAMTVGVGREVVVIGGESLASGNAHATVEAFDVDSGKWRALRPLNQGRHSGGVALLDDGIHVVAGNVRRGGGAETSSHERLALP